MSHNADIMAAIRLDKNLEDRARVAAKTIGLSVSDLIRTGLVRVIDEIEGTGQLTVSRAEQSEAAI
jgi:antitoxin component of RelBE/YafQ-DinJ toxin-antitoxin module